MSYDSAYHKLFSNPELVADLIQHFVDEDWVAQLDLNTLERVNAKFHSEFLERREGDVIYRVQMNNSGQEAYLCLLLEFQSTQDPWMALRILAYVALFYQHLVKEKQLSPNKQLPPVFPLVLYNGDRSWQQPTQLRSLIDLPKKARLWSYQPRMRYYLIDESLYPMGQSPSGKGESLSGTLFRLENVKTSQETAAVVGDLIELLKRYPNAERMGHDFTLFVKHVLKPAAKTDLTLEHMESLNEIHSMLRNRVEEWTKEWFEQGFEKGQINGESRMLAKQLQKRFGDLPSNILEKINDASEQELQTWGLNLLDAKSLDEVFKETK